MRYSGRMPILAVCTLMFAVSFLVAYLAISLGG